MFFLRKSYKFPFFYKTHRKSEFSPDFEEKNTFFFLKIGFVVVFFILNLLDPLDDISFLLRQTQVHHKGLKGFIIGIINVSIIIHNNFRVLITVFVVTFFFLLVF